MHENFSFCNSEKSGCKSSNNKYHSVLNFLCVVHFSPLPGNTRKNKQVVSVLVWLFIGILVVADFLYSGFYSDRTIYEELNVVLHELASAQGLPHVALLTRDYHVYPDFHGNRSPIADPTLKGMVSCNLDIFRSINYVTVWKRGCY